MHDLCNTMSGLYNYPLLVTYVGPDITNKGPDITNKGPDITNKGPY